MDDSLHSIVADQEQRRSQLDRMSDLGVTMTEATGALTIYGPGEHEEGVAFNVQFLDRPAIAFGCEIVTPDDVPPLAGAWPTLSACIFRWNRNDRDYYVGAVVGMVITGIGEQILNVHWSARGRAFRNPVPTS